jgi:hypothetical protein
MFRQLRVGVEKQQHIAPACLGSFIHLARTASWSRDELCAGYVGAKDLGHGDGEVCTPSIDYDEFAYL